jgi:hypothetical protein
VPWPQEYQRPRVINERPPRAQLVQLANASSAATVAKQLSIGPAIRHFWHHIRADPPPSRYQAPARFAIAAWLFSAHAKDKTLLGSSIGVERSTLMVAIAQMRKCCHRDADIIGSQPCTPTPPPIFSANHPFFFCRGCSISGLVAEYIVAIDVTRVRFPADADLIQSSAQTMP